MINISTIKSEDIQKVIKVSNTTIITSFLESLQKDINKIQKLATILESKK